MGVCRGTAYPKETKTTTIAFASEWVVVVVVCRIGGRGGRSSSRWALLGLETRQSVSSPVVVTGSRGETLNITVSVDKTQKRKKKTYQWPKRRI